MMMMMLVMRGNDTTPPPHTMCNKAQLQPTLQVQTICVSYSVGMLDLS
jgi:hypothetical protein